MEVTSAGQTGTVDKAIDILFHLHGSSEAQGVSAIGRALGLPKSSAHRLLATLARRDLVERLEPLAVGPHHVERVRTGGNHGNACRSG